MNQTIQKKNFDTDDCEPIMDHEIVYLDTYSDDDHDDAEEVFEAELMSAHPFDHLSDDEVEKVISRRFVSL